MGADQAVATLARRILALEARGAYAGGAVTDPEWLDLIVALWGRLRTAAEGRRNMRLPAMGEIVLEGDGHQTRAEVVDVSHTGLRIAGRLPYLRPGFRVRWASAHTRAPDPHADQHYALDVPCRVIWCGRDDDGRQTAGIEFAHAERPTWGKGFFDWYYRIYRDFLTKLAAEPPPAPPKPPKPPKRAAPATKPRKSKRPKAKARRR